MVCWCGPVAFTSFPNHELAIFNGKFQLLQLTEQENHRLPIDYFFNSLAQDQNQLAMAWSSQAVAPMVVGEYARSRTPAEW